MEEYLTNGKETDIFYDEAWCKKEYFKSLNNHAFSFSDNAVDYIFFNDVVHEKNHRKNFTLAHELIHRLNKDVISFRLANNSYSYIDKGRELHTNTETAEFLMPKDIFYSYAIECNYDSKKLSDKFQVSEDAVKIRINNIKNERKLKIKQFDIEAKEDFDRMLNEGKL